MNVSSARNGRALAQLGTYDPLHSSVKIDAERAIEWLNNGAQMSETVSALFESQGVLARWKGRESTVREDALTRDKPKRRRKIAAMPAQAPAAEAEEAPAAEAEEAPAAEAEEAPTAEAEEAPTAEAGEAPTAEAGEAPTAEAK